MKKVILVILSTLCIFTLISCAFAQTNNQIQEKEIIDLTNLDEYEVDQQIGQIIYHTEDFEGKILKCKGQCIPRKDGTYYCSFIREHVGCPNGIEFVLDNELEYPKEHDKIVIQGTIKSYQDENGHQVTLVNTKYIK